MNNNKWIQKLIKLKKTRKNKKKSLYKLMKLLNKNKKLNYKKYSKEVYKFCKKIKSKIIFEPGRSIIANAGVLISKITELTKKWKNISESGIQNESWILLLFQWVRSLS